MRRRGNSDPLDPYIASLQSAERLSPERERELEARVAAGEECARDELVKAHLRLVVRTALRFVGAFPLDELIAQGNYGLVLASRRFVPGRGSFTAFAIRYIRGAIFDFTVCEWASLGLSKARGRKVYQVSRAFRRSEMEAPSLTEQQRLRLVAQATGVSVEKPRPIHRLPQEVGEGGGALARRARHG